LGGSPSRVAILGKKNSIPNEKTGARAGSYSEIVLADRAKNIVQRLEYFDQYSKPLAEMELADSEKTYYLREISLDSKYFGRFYSKANYCIKVAGRGVDEVVQDIRMTLKL